MTEQEKVIKGLECCMKWTGEPNTATCHCSDCSYTNIDVLGERCLIDLINDALTLLKKQGNGKWIDHTYAYGDDIECPFCHKKWNVIDNCTETFDYCPGCGAKLS